MKIVKLLACILIFGAFFSDLIAQEITMFSSFSGNKYYQDDNEINKRDLQVLFDKNNEVSMYWKKSKAQELVAKIAIAAEMGFAVWMVLELSNDDVVVSSDRSRNALGPALGTIGTGIVGGIFLYASINSKKKAILTYNKQFDNKTTVRLVPTLDQKGLGLALQF